MGENRSFKTAWAAHLSTIACLHEPLRLRLHFCRLLERLLTILSTHVLDALEHASIENAQSFVRRPHVSDALAHLLAGFIEELLGVAIGTVVHHATYQDEIRMCKV